MEKYVVQVGDKITHGHHTRWVTVYDEYVDDGNKVGFASHQILGSHRVLHVEVERLDIALSMEMQIELTWLSLAHIVIDHAQWADGYQNDSRELEVEFINE